MSTGRSRISASPVVEACFVSMAGTEMNAKHVEEQASASTALADIVASLVAGVLSVRMENAKVAARTVLRRASASTERRKTRLIAGVA